MFSRLIGNRLSVVILFWIASSTSAFSQNGKISGKVIDAKTGETLPGASVLIDGTTLGAATDFDGNYSIGGVAPGDYNVVCRFISYSNKMIKGVSVRAGETVTVNISLEEPSSDTLGEVTIVATLNKENTNALLVMQKNNASVSDGVSAETIKKTPDRNTSDVLRRVSGASIQDNKFAIIRGLNDRYNAAYLNGAPLPSSESDRKAFSFDIFPSNMLDNLVINKTATPDMPAEFGGGIIQINTKSIPEKNFQSFSVNGGYNTLTTGKQRLYYKGGKSDWLGLDDGTRAMPSAVPTQAEFPTLPSAQAELAKNFKNDWGVNVKKFAPNMSFQYSMGRAFKRKEKDFAGMIVALSYNRNYNFNNTERKGYTSSSDLSVPSQVEFDYNDRVYSAQTLAGALGNFSVKINDNNALTFKNLFSINSDDRVIRREGTPTPLDPNPLLIRSTAQWFTSNKIYTGQLGGDHILGTSKIKVSWVGAYSTIQRDIPNLRRSIYARNTNFIDPTDPYPSDTMYAANIAPANVGPDYSGGMFWSQNREKIYSARGDVSYTVAIGNHFKNELKAGGAYQKRERDFFARQLGYIKYSVSNFNDSLLYQPEDQIFDPSHMGILSTGKKGFRIKDVTKPTDAYHATSELTAAYAMIDTRYKTWMRFIWGARLESFTQKLDATLDTKKPLNLNSSKFDVLPSVNAIFSLTEKQNIRACYSQTVNRPEFRELAPFAFYDFNTQFVYSGNDTLVRALIHNFDLRYEFYPGRGQLLSLTGFYKDFINPIEQVSRPYTSGEVSFANVPRAKSQGIEMEFRVVLGAILKRDSSRFLNNLTVFSNFAYIQSKVDVSSLIGSSATSRSLQGQSPYIFNSGLSYNDNDNGFSASAMLNRVGQRIAIVGNINEPDIWENGRTVVDLQLGKSFLKNKLELKFNVRDVLAQKQFFFQDRNGNHKLDKTKDDLIWVTNYGRTFQLSISCKF